MPGPVFGHIPGYPVGSRFENRAALAEAGVHRHRQAGISGSATKGADSIVLSGGYEDDQDLGNLIIYTGYGGRDPATGRQVSDQPFSLWNRALAYSSLNGLPVRVIRGEGHESRYSPSAGYRYEGLYLVDDYWQDRGRAGFLVWRYRLIKLPDQLDQESDQQSGTEGIEMPSEAPRRETTVLRNVRDTKQARRIKELYDYRCQMCGIRLEGLAGPYAEAAHIRPLGAPHNGPDIHWTTLSACVPTTTSSSTTAASRSTKIYLSSVSRADSQFIRATASTMIICATAGSTTKPILELQTPQEPRQQASSME